MSVKANWFIPEVDLGDAFAEEPAPVEEVGVPIRVDDAGAELDAKFVELVATEARLYNRGITCAIRDRHDTCCTACPLRGLDDSPVALCKTGAELEKVATRLAVVQGAGALGVDDGRRR